MDISVIIPAYNEEGRIGKVLSSLIDLECIKEIIVVNDGSDDGTSEEAKKYPVKVIDIAQNIGKAGAMKKGLIGSKGEWILFLDADLMGLSREHIQAMIDCAKKQDADMVIGLFTKGNLITDISHKIAPFLSGQRLIKRAIIENIDFDETIAYGIEIYLTNYFRKKGYYVKKVFMPNLYHIPKEIKRGFIKGKKEKLKMYCDIIFTVIQLYLIPKWLKKLYKCNI